MLLFALIWLIIGLSSILIIRRNWNRVMRQFDHMYFSGYDYYKYDVGLGLSILGVLLGAIMSLATIHSFFWKA